MKRLMTVMAAAICLAGHAEYIVKPTKGKLPEDVRTEITGGGIPLKSAYKKGWTDEGWTVGDYEKLKNILLCPSYMAAGDTCASALTLPLLTIEEGEWLSYDSHAGYPIRNEAHSVEIRRSGEEGWTKLYDATDEGYDWHHRMTDLSPYAGQELELRIVCRSEHGYMLLINGIRIGKLIENAFECAIDTPKFLTIAETADGVANIEFTIRNIGADADGVTGALLVGSERKSETEHQRGWKSGETRSFSLQLPTALNERTDYSIAVLTDEGGVLNAAEGFIYVTSKKRHLFVDKGTGMWCNSCPNGTLAMQALEKEYGDALIGVETHNGDPLANDMDFAWLKFYSIPQLELNRIQVTKGEGSSKFSGYICQPTEMEISLTGVSAVNDSILSVSAEVSTSEAFDADGRSYRIGYTLTRDVPGTENKEYYQKNICTLASQKEYSFLPSLIFYDLCSFPDVSLPSPTATGSANPAFTGIEGSLPDRLEAGKSYSCVWEIRKPTEVSDFSGLRLVAYILDAGSRTIQNCTAEAIDTLADVAETGVEAASAHPEGVYSMDGRYLGSCSEQLAKGLYIVNGKKTLVR